jgi:hypothetical protein
MLGCSQESLGVAQTIVRDYFQVFMAVRGDAVRYYSHKATLNWEGNDYQGLPAIQDFLNTAPVMTFQISSYEAQTVPRTEVGVWTMLVVTGTVGIESGMRSFHSTFYLEADPDTKQAVIHYHTFQSF